MSLSGAACYVTPAHVGGAQRPGPCHLTPQQFLIASLKITWKGFYWKREIHTVFEKAKPTAILFLTSFVLILPACQISLFTFISSDILTK